MADNTGEQRDQPRMDLSKSENTAREDNKPSMSKDTTKQSKAGQILSGNKFFILLAGGRLQCNEDLTVQLRKKVPQLQEVKTVNECDFILVFCPVVTRAGTDIEEAVKTLHDSSATKPAVLVVLHHTFDPGQVVPDSSRAVKRENTITVDCLFHEEQGLLQCKKNYDAIKHIEMQIKPKPGNMADNPDEQRDQSPMNLSDSENTATEDNQPRMSSKNTTRSEIEVIEENVQKQKMSGKINQILSGNKFFILLAGVKLKCNEDLTFQLRKKVPQLQEVKTVNGCDFILVFCPVVTRAGIDIEEAVKKLHDSSATKPAVLVVLHHTFDPECVVPDSSRAVNRENTITVDCLFHEDQGLLPCKKNYDAIKCIEMQINPKIKKTVSAQGENKLKEWWNNRNEQRSSTQPCDMSGSKNNQKPAVNRQAVDKVSGEIENLKTFKNEIIEKEAKVLINNEVIITTELRLVLLGRTRSDKAAVKNIILGREERSQAATTTTTATQQSESTQEVPERKVTVVDTSDLPDISLEEIGQSVGPQAFLLVIPIKYSEDNMHTLSKMEEILSERCWRNTMILFTVSNECQKMNIEEFIKSGDLELQRLVEKCGNRFHCLNIMESEDGFQVLELLEKIEKMLEGNRNGIEIYQTIREMERERHEKDARIREVQHKMQTSLKKFKQFIRELENDLKIMGTDKGNVDKRQIVDKLIKENELKRDVGEHIKKMFDRIAGLEQNRQFIKVILPENQQTIWLSLPDQQSKNLDKYNELDQLEEWFSKSMGKL